MPHDKDFTLRKYKTLLEAILQGKYDIINVRKYLTNPKRSKRFIILRHDVDKKPLNALMTARLENQFGISSTYYFRTTEEVYKTEIIKEMHDMGHEIGYHYEVLAKSGGDIKKAIKTFEQELSKFREIVPIQTICMHGSPLAKWNDCQLWNHYDFRDYGIIGEVFLSTDFEKITYFTDTGRQWNGEKYSVRDKVDSNQKWRVRTTDELITLLKTGELKKAMINAHPQRWSDKMTHWIGELVGQNVKNVGKRLLIKEKRD